MSAVPLSEIVGYLDEYLRIREVPDERNAVNGLQVENQGLVGSIVAAVDASQPTIDGVAAGRPGAEDAPPLLLVHHGLFWDGNVPLTGRRYRRVAALLEHDIALYSAHIPLDLHAVVGNNVVLAERLGLAVEPSILPRDSETEKEPAIAFGEASRVQSNSAAKQSIAKKFAASFS